MDPYTVKVLTAAIFVLTYGLIIKFYDKKIWILMGGTAAILAIGAVSLTEGFRAINWNVLAIYVGMLFLVQALIESKVADYIAIWFINKTKSVGMAMLAVCTMSGLLSIVIENVACVLIMAPIAFSLAKKIQVSPVPIIIGSAICSNLQGAATLIGDPPSMILAGHAGLEFNDFFIFQGKPGLFFAVQIGMIAGLAVLYFQFKHYNHPVHKFEQIRVKSLFPSIMLAMMVVLLTVSSWLNGGSLLGVICLVFGTASLGWLLHEHRKKEKRLWHSIRDMDWQTALFIIAVFVFVQSLSSTGIITDIANVVGSISGSSVLSTFIVVIMISVVMSAFIDNVPYLVAMLPVAQTVATNMQVPPYLLYFGLLLGTSIGGNITPIGASTNIVGVGLLKNHGHETNFWHFLNIGLPFTLVSVAASCAFIWIMYGI